MKVLCDECHGRGKIEGLGYMQTKCFNCDGIGYINKPDDAEATISEPNERTSPPQRRRGRKRAQRATDIVL